MYIARLILISIEVLLVGAATLIPTLEPDGITIRPSSNAADVAGTICAVHHTVPHASVGDTLTSAVSVAEEPKFVWVTVASVPPVDEGLR